MVSRTVIVALLLMSCPSFGAEPKAVAEMERFHSDVKRQARVDAIEEQQNYYCTEELKLQLSQVLQIPPNPVTGEITIPPYQAWKLEELYKTCSAIKNPSKTTSMLLNAIPPAIKQSAQESMQRQ